MKPMSPLKTFSAREIGDAFRYMQKGVHMGKIVVLMPAEATSLPSTPTARSLQLRADRSYLLVGGLGGIGRAVATWMIECGARHLVFLSRSATSPAHTDWLAELRSQGCEVQTISGSVIDLDDVKFTVENASKPIGGVIQMSMVLRVSHLHTRDGPRSFLCSTNGQQN